MCNAFHFLVNLYSSFQIEIQLSVPWRSLDIQDWVSSSLHMLWQCGTYTSYSSTTFKYRFTVVPSPPKKNCIFSVQFSSVTQSCQTHFDLMDCSTPGFRVHHQLLELTQTHVHHVGDAIQQSHPLSSPSPPAFNLSQHQGLFQNQFFASGGQSIGVSASTSVLPMNTQDWSPLGWTGWISLQSKGLSRVFSNTTVRKHQFFSAQLSL